MTVDAALMTFGRTEEPFEVEVVAREVVVADEKPVGKGGHDLSHLGSNGVGARIEVLGEREEFALAQGGLAALGVEQSVDFSDHLDMVGDLSERLASDLEPFVYAPDERGQGAYRAPFSEAA